MRGAERLIAVDLSPQRLELAERFGATDTIVAGDGGEVEKILPKLKDAGK